MSENLYASPEPVTEPQRPRLTGYCLRLERLRMGMGRFAWAAAAEVMAVLLMTRVDSLSNIIGFCLLMTALTLQLMGTFRCMACPPNIVYGGPWRLLMGWGLCIAGVWMIIGDYGDRYEFYGVMCIAASRLTWLWFLMSVGAGVKNRRAWWLALAAVGLWLLTAASRCGELASVPQLRWAFMTSEALFLAAWTGFMFAYLPLLLTLYGWLGELVEMKPEGEGA